MANALSAARGLLAIPFGLAMLDPSVEAATWAGILLLVAIVSDLIDGPLARRRGGASAFGGSLDHGSDFCFVMAGLVAGTARDAFPVALPIFVAVAFAQYVIDSYWLHRQGSLRMSKLGRWNGIAYFVPLAGDVLARGWLGMLAVAVEWICWVLVGTTLLSIADRALSLRSHKPDAA